MVLQVTLMVTTNILQTYNVTQKKRVTTEATIGPKNEPVLLRDILPKVMSDIRLRMAAQKTIKARAITGTSLKAVEHIAR